jgi:rhamnosyl/mannosyltransferase
MSFKILHLGKYYHPFHGGIESIVRDICEGLVKKGAEVSVICSNDSARREFDKINGVEILRLARYGVLFSQSITPDIVRIKNMIRDQYDIVHVHCPNPLAELFCSFIPKEIPVIITHHSDVIRQDFLMPFYAPVAKKFYGRANKILVATENHIKYGRFISELEDKCKIVPFGIPVEHLKPRPEVIEKAMEFQRKFGPYFLFVGRMVGYKGIPTLLEAAKETKQNVVLVGGGDRLQKYKQMAIDMGIQDQVHFEGRVYDSTSFAAYYHGCQGLVLPSVTANENFGVVQLEAMACGKPVITTNLKSGVPQVGVKNETTLIVEPGNAQELGMAMQFLMDQPNRGKAMGEKGRERFKQMYTLQKMIDAHYEEYERTLDIHRAISKHFKKAS